MAFPSPRCEWERGSRQQPGNHTKGGCFTLTPGRPQRRKVFCVISFLSLRFLRLCLMLSLFSSLSLVTYAWTPLKTVTRPHKHLHSFIQYTEQLHDTQPSSYFISYLSLFIPNDIGSCLRKERHALPHTESEPRAEHILGIQRGTTSKTVIQQA